MKTYDAIIVGASIGGCTAAMTLARMGWNIALLERSPDEEHHKKLCTHFIQPSALPVLERLGLVRAIESAGGVRTHTRLCTPWGWIDGQPEEQDQKGFNLSRQKLDPLLRHAAENEPRIDYFAGANVVELLKNDRQEANGVAVTLAGSRQEFHAPLVVAADGRNSTIAKLAKIPTYTDRNDRFSYFTYYPGALLTAGGNANFWHQEDRLAFAYENGDGTSLLGIFLPLDRLPEFRQDPLMHFREFWNTLPYAPAIGTAQPLTELRGFVSYPNQRREPIDKGLALIGDASMSIDPMWAAGCSFAIMGGDWLAQSFRNLPLPRDCSAKQIAAGLARYARLQRAATRWHYWQISDFSKQRPARWLERWVFSAAVHDRTLARVVFRLTERIASPLTFGSPTTLLRAAWTHTKQFFSRAFAPTKTPSLTRVPVPTH